MAEKYYPTEEEIEKAMANPEVNKAQMMAIEIERMTGKLVSEK